MKTALTILGVVVIGGLIWWLVARNNGTDAAGSSANTACTMEAKLCPDGSYVGREGPNCEFRACPGSASSTDNQNNNPLFEKG